MSRNEDFLNEVVRSPSRLMRVHADTKSKMYPIRDEPDSQWPCIVCDNKLYAYVNTQTHISTYRMITAQEFNTLLRNVEHLHEIVKGMLER